MKRKKIIFLLIGILAILTLLTISMSVYLYIEVNRNRGYFSEQLQTLKYRLDESDKDTFYLKTYIAEIKTKFETQNNILDSIDNKLNLNIKNVDQVMKDIGVIKEDTLQWQKDYIRGLLSIEEKTKYFEDKTKYFEEKIKYLEDKITSLMTSNLSAKQAEPEKKDNQPQKEEAVNFRN